MFTTKKLKSILSLLVCSLLILPPFQPVKCCSPICQTASPGETAQKLIAFHENQRDLVDLARDYGRTYHEIIHSTRPRTIARCEALEYWKQNIFEYFIRQLKKNIYMSACFFKLVCCQKDNIARFPSPTWYRNIEDIDSILVEIVDPIKRNCLFLMDNPPAEKMIQIMIRYLDGSEECIYI